jgi:hypothetical protein
MSSPGDSDLITTDPALRLRLEVLGYCYSALRARFSFDLFHSRTEKLVLTHSLKAVPAKQDLIRISPTIELERLLRTRTSSPREWAALRFISPTTADLPIDNDGHFVQ